MREISDMLRKMHRGRTIRSSHAPSCTRYTGHRPGLQFGFGNTFGELTHLCLEKPDDYSEVVNRPTVLRRPLLHRDEPPRKFHLPDPKNDSSAVGELLTGSATPYSHIYKLGRRSGDFRPSAPNGFKSGYTGYVPRLRYQYGGTYNCCSEEAVKEFDKIQSSNVNADEDVPWSALTASQYGGRPTPLIPITSDQQIRERLLDFKMQQLKGV